MWANAVGSPDQVVEVRAGSQFAGQRSYIPVTVLAAPHFEAFWV